MWWDAIVLGAGVRGGTMRGVSTLVRGPFRTAAESCLSCTVRCVLRARCWLPCWFGADLKAHVSTPDHLSRADFVLTTQRRTRHSVRIVRRSGSRRRGGHWPSRSRASGVGRKVGVAVAPNRGRGGQRNWSPQKKAPKCHGIIGRGTPYSSPGRK